MTQNTLANSIDITEYKSRYDSACKYILGHREILAWILKYAVEEFKDISTGDICNKYIEGSPEISKVRVLPGETNPSIMGLNTESNPSIIGLNTESNIYEEGSLTFDIIFYALLPFSKNHIKLFINVEAQDDYYPGYDIQQRGIFYGSRMISSQYGRVFVEPDYNKIQKVYSVWICMSPPKKYSNSLSCICLDRKDLIGSVPMEKNSYDLLSVMIIRLGGKKNQNYTGIFKLLDTLLSPELSASNKKQILENDFNISMNQDLGKEIDDMCNLSQGVWRRGIEEGIEQGIEQGLSQGIEQGRLYTLFALVDEGLITVNKASEMAGISAEDFKLKKENWK